MNAAILRAQAEALEEILGDIQNFKDCSHARVTIRFRIDGLLERALRAEEAQPVAWEVSGDGIAAPYLVRDKARLEGMLEESGKLGLKTNVLALYTQPPAEGWQPEKAEYAKLYEWLRNRTWDQSSMCVVAKPRVAVRLGYDCPSHNRLDEMIREAMARGE